jgi:uncharacterized membrane protein YqaE (UPF0057 family)
VLPPLTAALAALCGAWLEASGPTLVVSAVLGYGLGAVWLLPAWRRSTHTGPEPQPQETPTQSDPRSTRLRLAHTLCDALLATSVVVVWQRLYGAQDTGWLTALLRVLGFVPALVHLAWAQVVLAQGMAAKPTHASPRDVAPLDVALNPPHPHASVHPASRMAWLMGLGAAVCVAALAWVCALALDLGWLDARWSGVWAYLLPVAIWQAGACVLAAFSHRPFQTQAAVRYSWACIALTGVQAVVLWWPVLVGSSVDASQHITAFASVSGVGLLALSVWLARLR